jgi:hypothetical protein
MASIGIMAFSHEKLLLGTILDGLSAVFTFSNSNKGCDKLRPPSAT